MKKKWARTLARTCLFFCPLLLLSSCGKAEDVSAEELNRAMSHNFTNCLERVDAFTIRQSTYTQEGSEEIIEFSFENGNKGVDNWNIYPDGQQFGFCSGEAFSLTENGISTLLPYPLTMEEYAGTYIPYVWIDEDENVKGRTITREPHRKGTLYRMKQPVTQQMTDSNINWGAVKGESLEQVLLFDKEGNLQNIEFFVYPKGSGTIWKSGNIEIIYNKSLLPDDIRDFAKKEPVYTVILKGAAGQEDLPVIQYPVREGFLEFACDGYQVSTAPDMYLPALDPLPAGDMLLYFSSESLN